MPYRIDYSPAAVEHLRLERSEQASSLRCSILWTSNFDISLDWNEKP